MMGPTARDHATCSSIAKHTSRILTTSLIVPLLLLVAALVSVKVPSFHTGHPVSPRESSAISRCRELQSHPRELSGHTRSESDRYVQGAKPVLLQHARIWTGRENGTEIIKGDILLDKGLIKEIGYIPLSRLKPYDEDMIIVDLDGKWVSPGIVDMHSHIGISAAPELLGSSNDYNSELGNIQVTFFSFLTMPIDWSSSL